MTCAGVAFCVVGWIGTAAGPRGWLLFGVLGLLLAAVSNVVTFARPAEPRARNGALYRGIRMVMTVSGWLAVLSLVTMLASARTDGVADFPALEVRATYELSTHGRRTPVSRTRYVLASAALGTGWHAMAVLANLAALRRRLYGVEP